MRLARRWAEPVPVDIAPLIDVVFQLLIYFLLTTSIIVQPGIRVMLPKATTGEHIPKSGIVITLTKDHLMYVNDAIMTLHELRRTLANASATTPVLIRADRYAYVDKLIALWDLCRDAGLQEVRIATLPE